jgi:hypothetical protein
MAIKVETLLTASMCSDLNRGVCYYPRVRVGRAMQRVGFTRKFLRSLAPPEKGELWIADAVVPGFGIRLWATKSGGQAAFAIRSRDLSGVVRRKTFEPRSTFTYALADKAQNLQLSDFLDDAREWARSEIAQLRGRLTPAERRMLRWSRARDRVRSLTLGQAAQDLLDDMKSRYLTQSYTDRQDQLFNGIIPKELRDTNVALVEPTAVAAALVRQDIPPGNIRILRSFIGQIYQRLAQTDGTMRRFSAALSEAFWKRWETHYDVAFPELRDLKPEDYRRVFELLENDENWQQALCIRLFFEFGAPLTRLMAAKWSQILGDHWYPYWPDERILWFEARERIEGDTPALLERVKFLVRRDFPTSEYWFPSHFARSSKHIRTIDPTWRHTLYRAGSPPYRLREFALSYRDAHNPSYLASFLRQYGQTFRAAQNADGVSKTLTNRKNSCVKSIDYG